MPYNPNPAATYTNTAGYSFYSWGSAPAGLAGTYAGLLQPSPQVVAAAPNPTPVTPNFDPKIEANALYGKPMPLFTGGFARIGASPAPIVGPYIGGGVVDMIVSFGVPSNPGGDRKVYAIYLDSELAWSSPGGGTLPGDGTFAAEAFDFVFKPGTLTQTVCSLETSKFPGDECAYRPQMLLQITGLPYARFMANTGKPVPYVACDIGDVTDGADPHDGINLGEALERIAFSPWCGYTSSTFEAVDITDVVDAILIKDNFTMVQLCQNVTRDYKNIDLLQSDKLRVRDRGSNVTPDIVFDRDSVIGGDNPISISRAGATVQRRERELSAIDPDQDYTVVPSLSKIPREPFVISAAVGKDSGTSPLVINAHTRQALVTFAHYYEENARKRVSLKVMAQGFEIEPGDAFALVDLADGVDDEVWKVTETLHGANYEVELTGAAVLRCQLGFNEPDASWISHYELAATPAAQSYSIALGDAASDRVIVIAGAGATNNRTVSSVTIDTGSGAEAMTIHHQSMDAGVGGGFHDVTMFIASKTVPTGTTATVVVTYSGALDGSFIDVYRLVGLVDPSGPTDTVAATATGASNPSTAVDVPNSGVVIGVFAATDTSYPGNLSNFGSVSWTGIGSENSDEDVFTTAAVLWSSSAAQSGLGAQTGRTVGASNTVTGRKSIIVGAWH